MQKLQVKILDPRIGNDIPLPEYATVALLVSTCAPAWTKRSPSIRVIPFPIKTGLVYIEDPALAGIILPRSGSDINTALFWATSLV